MQQSVKEISAEVQIVELRAQNSYLSERALILSQTVADMSRELSAMRDRVEQMAAVKRGDDSVIAELQTRIDALSVPSLPPLPGTTFAPAPSLSAIPSDIPLTSLAG